MVFSGAFRAPVQAPIAKGEGVGNGLLNSLIGYWPGNEVSGNALDLHTNGLTLNDIYTVTSGAGLVYPTARQYTPANQEWHTRPGDDAILSTGDVDFTIAIWCNPDATPHGNIVVGKFDNNTIGGGSNEYMIYFVSGKASFYVYPNGSTGYGVEASALGALSIGSWYLLIAWHDSVANTINIQGNNGTVNSAAHTLGVKDAAAPFVVGGRGYGNYWSGRAMPAAFWKSAAGLGGVLTPAQRTALYNNGAGLPYAQFTT